LENQQQETVASHSPVSSVSGWENRQAWAKANNGPYISSIKAGMTAMSAHT
jgi:hypothetical protein